jgi:hypothetical protein
MVLALLILLAAPLAADEIKLGDFPRGQWIDPQWQAYLPEGGPSRQFRVNNDCKPSFCRWST